MTNLNEKRYVIEQYVKEVTDFSSQYGSSGSISYVANNLIGKPALYPEYGDFSASYSMQTYGLWWRNCPSAAPYVEDSYCLYNIATDFVDLKFEHVVNPTRIDIYETYNPGSVIRIWGSLEGKEWIILWSGISSCQPAQARIFSPPISQVEKIINMIRLEFNQGCQEYYSALDAVTLVGESLVSNPIVLEPKCVSFCVQNLGILNSPISLENVLTGIEYIMSTKLSDNFELSSQLENIMTKEDYLIKSDAVYRSQTDVVDHKTAELDGGYFSMLPEELILHILKQAGIQSLCRLAQTCKLMRSYVSQSILYQHLNLKNCWWLVTDTTLEWLTLRCQQLKSLDLSWCGGYDVISSQIFMEFIHQCGYNLTLLHVNNCQFIDNYCLYIIANTCSFLEVLSLASCTKIDQLGFGELKKLTRLKYLDLSRTRIEFRNLHILLQRITELNHLLLNNCKSLDIDEVALTLATFNPCLISLGAWKTSPLTSRGLRALSCIKTLQELDLGWALFGTITEGLGELVRGCINLRKLFCTALRTLTDNDVNLIATHAMNMEQLDLMGTRNISPEAILNLLKKCEKLQLLDVNYCEMIHYSHVQQWSVLFPHVSIKGGLKHPVRLI